MAEQQVRRRYLGESAETRIAARRRQLLDAAFVCLAADGGWRQMSIAQLCTEAKLNKRYFYESFADLDEVAGAVVDDLASQLLALSGDAAATGMAAGLDTGALAGAVLRAAIGWLAEDSRRATVLFATVNDHPRAMVQRRRAIDTLAAGLTTFSLDYHGAPEPLPISRVGSALLIGGSIEVVLGWLDDPSSLTFDELVDDLAAFWVAVGSSAVELSERRGTRRAR